MLGGFPGGQAEYLRVPFADVGPLKIESDLPDDKVVFLSDIFPTGYMAAENCGIEPGDTVAVWGCGPVAQFAIKSAWMLGCIDAVGCEAHSTGGLDAVIDKAKSAVMLTTDRAHVLRQAIFCCRKGGTLSVPGVYVGLPDKIPMGAFMNKGLTMKSGQTHMQKYMKPLLARIEKGEIDPSFVITHRVKLDDAPAAYATFRDKKDKCIKVVLHP